jgi:acyl-homoserine lactone acylase PvdQ
MRLKKLLYAALSGSILLTSTALTPVAQAEIEVVRDEYGVAKISTDKNNELFMAFGFVHARDRLIQIELLRQNAWGKLPDIAGGDQRARSNRNARIAHRYPNMRSNLLNELKSVKPSGSVNTVEALKCFATGINMFRQMLRNQFRIDDGPVFDAKSCGAGVTFPQSLVKDAKLETPEYQFLMNILQAREIDISRSSRWTALDVLAIFQNRVMDEFSYRNTDLNNMRLLFNLMQEHKDNNFREAGRLFNSIKWSLMPTAKTTIPLPPKNPKNAADLRTAANIAARQYHKTLIDNLSPNKINDCTIYNMKAFLMSSSKGQLFADNSQDEQFPRNASNWWTISKARQSDPNFSGVANDVNSILYNGPQTGANDPSNTYQIALKSKEGFQFAGNTYTGTINFWQGHNDTMAFGLTAGNIDVADSFCVKVTKNNNGPWTYLNKNKDTIQLELNKPASTAANTDLFNVKRYDWPVIFIDTLDGREGTAYIQRSNWEGLAASSLDSMLQASQAKTVEGWNESLDTVAGNFNLSAAHKDGTIAYRLTGKIPVKAGMEQQRKLDNIMLSKPDMKTDAKSWNYFPNFDPRLPVPMAPEDGWDNNNNIYHALKFTAKGGFLANWNQKPWTLMPDGDLYYDGYYPYDRVQFIISKLRAPKDGGWTLKKVLSMNGDLQRMDVNYFAYKFFLRSLLSYPDRDQNIDPALNTILAWSGYREAKPGSGDTTGRVHYGHVLFYEFLEALNNQLIQLINPSNNEGFKTQLQKVLFKLKQPKLNHEENKTSLTVDTSQNMQMSSRILLNTLHHALNKKNLDAQQWTYDDYQANFIEEFERKNGGNNAPLEEAAYEVLTNALNVAINKIADYPGYNAQNLGTGNAWFLSTMRTLMGFPTGLGFRDLQVSFRDKPLYINDFRNRGALNVGVAFKTDGTVEAMNVTPPGIREYRGLKTNQKGGLVTDSKNADTSSNQGYMYGLNSYRMMHQIKDN